MRTRRPILALLAALALAVPVAAAGCGDDDDSATTQAAPLGIEEFGASGASGPQGHEPGDGGGDEPQDFDPNAEDTEGNDIPPPPGSPQERFEQFCTDNPQACD